MIGSTIPLKNATKRVPLASTLSLYIILGAAFVIFRISCRAWGVQHIIKPKHKVKHSLADRTQRRSKLLARLFLWSRCSFFFFFFVIFLLLLLFVSLEVLLWLWFEGPSCVKWDVVVARSLLWWMSLDITSCRRRNAVGADLLPWCVFS